jgi:Trk-type K+ transport system membrane component
LLKSVIVKISQYYIFIQALGWAVSGASFSKPQYQGVFSGQWKFVQPSWAGVFLGTSAVTNSGMSLVDTGLIPFQGEPGVLITTSFVRGTPSVYNPFSPVI